MDRYFRVEGKLVFPYSYTVPAEDEDDACEEAKTQAQMDFDFDEAKVEEEEVDYLGTFHSAMEAKQYGGR